MSLDIPDEAPISRSSATEHLVSEVQPQPGDKAVHVGDTVEAVLRGTVSVANGGDWIAIKDDNGVAHSIKPSNFTTFTVVERADDPSRDEIGTMAELNGKRWVHYRSDCWAPFDEDEPIRYNDEMHGRRVTGAVPGTAAAQAQQPTIDSDRVRAFETENGPLLREPQPEPIRVATCGQCSAPAWRPHREDCPEVVGP